MRRARRHPDDRGASLVELAIIAPVMALLVMGVLDLTRSYRTQIRLENAAREGAVFGQLYPNDVSCSTRDDITKRVHTEEPGLASLLDFKIEVLTEDASGNLVVPVTGCGGTTAKGGKRLLVKLSATYDVVTPMVERATGGDVTLTGAAEVRIQP